ncbi:alpha-L-rhamnosidase [Pedobacter paludis]|uniref:alpha-L-rhamnosidase n=1 Tax=Pedobacter paludis TaxID=2203212 RepID=A0A317EY86_9SPHI|nr:alpha-L-rhamnosidase [Pedobacter paludis]PWS31535.1 alpha-L-rhamnosidase [Pedobacter paludis]
MRYCYLNPNKRVLSCFNDVKVLFSSNLKSSFLLFAFQFFFAIALGQNLNLSGLTVNYKSNPVGIEASDIRFSWKITSDVKQIMQKSYEIRVATNESDLLKGKNLVWESGKIETDQSAHIPYSGKILLAKQRYFWQVKITDKNKNASTWSTTQFFETGMLSPSDWSANWIETSLVTDGKVGPAPIFAKKFELVKTIKSARLYITAHGLYEATLNGKRIGNQFFAPGWTSYHKRLQYQTYDVTSLLKTGDNSTFVTVGDGWYRGNLEFNNKRNTYGKEVGLLYQLEVVYNDGTSTLIASDGTWKSSFEGPIKKSDIYNGETFDARLVRSSKDLSSTSWKPVKVASYAKENLVSPLGPAVVQHENFSPIKIFKTPKGETVADFGQNLVGWVKLNIHGTKGDTVTLNHAEVLDKDGNFYTDNLRNAKQENKYVLSGAKEDVLEPHFTFQGFRYVKISGYKNTLTKDNLTAIAIYSDMKPTGEFTSSNALINQLQHNIQWGQKGNFLDVPTDCPQRDERLGWTGDAQVFFSTAAFNMDVAGFFSKWLADLKVDQHPTGNVPVVIPDVRAVNNAGSAGWGDVATIIPYNYYLAYGDKDLLGRQYSSMKAWVEYIKSISKQNLWNSGPHYGDWLFYTKDDDRDGKAAITDKFLIAQIFYAASTQNVINAAKALGKDDDAKQYQALLKEIKSAFMKEYVTPAGRLVSSSQTAYVLALNFDMLPEDLRPQAAQRLAENVESYKNHLTTGFLGTPYLCAVLSRFGYADLAYKLLLQETYPSWLYPVKKGATTIWERWDGIKPDGSFQATSMNSFNHYAYGAIGDWMYKTVAGLNYDAEEPGYKKIIISPILGGKFTEASAKLESIYGPIQSSWKLDGERFILDVVVPPNTSANVILPNSTDSEIMENNKEAGKQTYLKKRNDELKNKSFEVGSGRYHFEYNLSK